jgi:hypothetical protein
LDSLDLSVGSGYTWLEDKDSGLAAGHGIADTSLSAKWRFFEDEQDGLGVAFVPTFTMPTGRKSTANRLGPSQNFLTMDTRFALVKDWSERWSSNVDIGYVIPFGDREDYRGSLGANVAVGYHLLSRFQPELELNYNRDFIAGSQDADRIAVTVGADMPFSDRVCVRGGVQQGIAGRNTDQSTTFLLSIDLNF